MTTEKPKECDACNFETEELTFYKHGAGFPEGEGNWLCDVCANTVMGNMNRYPNQYDYTSKRLSKMIAVCTNMILSEIKKH